MKKDYIYQDKDQFKLMQNAEKIGSFLVSDQDVIIDDNVLPEQRFAHQPIFRRPPEELVTTFSYIHNFNQGVFSTTNSTIGVANLFKKSSTTNPDGVHLLYKYTGWAGAPYLQNILLKNWSAESLLTSFFTNNSCWGFWTTIANMGYEGTTLKSHNHPVFFKDYIFFKASTFTDAIYYAKLNPKKTETKEIKVAIQENGRQFYSLCWLYEDSTDPDYRYKMVVYKQDGAYEPRKKAVIAYGAPGLPTVQWETDLLAGSSNISAYISFEQSTGTYYTGNTYPIITSGCGGTFIAPIVPSNYRNTTGFSPFVVRYDVSVDNYSENLVQYKANSLEGPWVYDKTWKTFDPPTVYGSPAYTAIIQELASLILSKTHKNLSISVSGDLTGSDWAFQDVLSETYDPPYTSGWAGIYSRGEEGEIVWVWEGSSPGKKYLIKRQGNGQMKKTLFTDIGTQ